MPVFAAEEGTEQMEELPQAESEEVQEQRKGGKHMEELFLSEMERQALPSRERKGSPVAGKHSTYTRWLCGECQRRGIHQLHVSSKISGSSQNRNNKRTYRKWQADYGRKSDRIYGSGLHPVLKFLQGGRGNHSSGIGRKLQQLPLFCIIPPG